jgi:hypothetical protein
VTRCRRLVTATNPCCCRASGDSRCARTCSSVLTLLGSVGGASPSGRKNDGVKRATALVVLAFLAAACGGGRATAERHLVFVRGTEPINATVWIADATGRHARRLTRGYAAVVAPNGHTIAVGRWDGIHLVSSDGKHERRLTSTNRRPEAWSDNGKWIVATTDCSLTVVDADSGQARLLARGVFYGFGFSPDGRRLIYGRAPRKGGEDICTARIDLYVVLLVGGERSRLTRDGRSGFPVWGRRRIAFMRLPRRVRFDDCFAPGIWAMRRDGSNVQAIIARAARAIARAGYYGCSRSPGWEAEPSRRRSLRVGPGDRDARRRLEAASNRALLGQGRPRSRCLL